jgi:DNA replication protein DnaC
MREPKKGQESLIKYDSTMADDGENCYSFDYIFAKNANQKEVYSKISIRHIDDFFIGRNSTIFAYGQTGSGKTYTMFGSMNDPHNYGIIPRTLYSLFKAARKSSNGT